MTRQADLLCAEKFGFDYCGFIFHEKSPRYIDPQTASGLESGAMRRVGVFVSQNAAEIASIMKTAKLDMAQLHGAQTRADALAIGPEKVIRVMWPERYGGRLEFLEAAAAWADSCAMYLLDAGYAAGGSGRRIDMDWLRDLVLPKPWFLAGGLGAQNIEAALALHKPYGVDLNSGLEIEPGQKDHAKIEFVVRVLKKKERKMKGYFGEFGGMFVPELLIPPLLEVEKAMREIMPAREFQEELDDLLANFAGRPTPLTACPTLSRELGFNLWLKREDLLHTGAHKINNTIGQALLARHMGKKRLVAETGAGQHGVATAAAAARLGMECVIYMGAEDVARQSANVRRMRLLGAEVHPVDSGTRTLKDAINATLREWISSQATTHYCFGTATGPHPFPTLVREFQSVIGKETKKRMRELIGRLPDAIVACVGGGSNAIGMFHPFVDNGETRLVGVEAAGSGEKGCYNSAPINLGSPGVLHGSYSMLLQTEDGQILPSHSISAGLDYPGVGPEHAWLAKTGRVHYGLAKDSEALAAFFKLCETEGMLPAVESSHALAWVLHNRHEFAPGSHVVVNLSGRGDKDMDIIEAVQAAREDENARA